MDVDLTAAKLGHTVPPVLARTLALDDDALLEMFEGVPFVVPGGRFNEMYGWDSYFEVCAPA